MKFSEVGTLILPLPKITSETFTKHLQDTVEWGGKQFFMKEELHLTVFGFKIGKKFRDMFNRVPGLEESANNFLASYLRDFHLGTLIRVRPVWYHVSRVSLIDNTELSTICVAVEWMLMGTLYDGILRSIPRDEVNLRDALLFPPPQHVTVYTTDTQRKNAIGLNSMYDIDKMAQTLVEWEIMPRLLKTGAIDCVVNSPGL